MMPSNIHSSFSSCWSHVPQLAATTQILSTNSLNQLKFSTIGPAYAIKLQAELAVLQKISTPSQESTKRTIKNKKNNRRV